MGWAKDTRAIWRMCGERVWFIWRTAVKRLVIKRVRYRIGSFCIGPVPDRSLGIGSIENRGKAHRRSDSIRCILNGTRSPMAVQYYLYQIEAKAAAAGGAVPGALLPVERLIQMGQSVLPDMRFCVFHRHSWTPVLPAAPDTDPGPHPENRGRRWRSGSPAPFPAELHPQLW